MFEQIVLKIYKILWSNKHKIRKQSKIDPTYPSTWLMFHADVVKCTLREEKFTLSMTSRSNLKGFISCATEIHLRRIN